MSSSHDKLSAEEQSIVETVRSFVCVRLWAYIACMLGAIAGQCSP